MQGKLEKGRDFLNELLESPEVVDIFVFGSSVKGKALPRDIDLLVVFQDTVPAEKLLDIEMKLRDTGYDAVCVSYNHLFKEEHLLSTVLFEGISMKAGSRVSSRAGFSSVVLFVYRHKLPGTQRVRFFRAIKSLKTAKFLGKGVILVSVSEEAITEEIFERFGIKYRKIPVLAKTSFLMAIDKIQE